MLAADLKKALKIPSQSILFNIDQKADVIAKNQADALLSVFVKVFNEVRGYYGKQGYIAKFEADLDEHNQFAAFKETYLRVNGSPWERDRDALIRPRVVHFEVTGDNWEWIRKVRVPLQGVALSGALTHGVAMGCQRIAPCGASDSTPVRSRFLRNWRRLVEGGALPCHPEK